MRKLALIGATLALLTPVGAPPIASAAPTAARHGTQVLHYIAHQTSLEVIDVGAPGDSPGDQVMETEALLRNGVQFGRDAINCVAITVTATAVDALCHGAIVLDDGQIEFQGETTFSTPFTIGVTGGTGIYQNVGGQLTVERTLPNEVDDVTTLRLVFFETR
jgi:hypothetical protein